MNEIRVDEPPSERMMEVKKHVEIEKRRNKGRARRTAKYDNKRATAQIDFGSDPRCVSAEVRRSERGWSIRKAHRS